MAFERILSEGRDRYDVAVYSFQLMPNHWHLVLRPNVDGEMSQSRLDRTSQSTADRIGTGGGSRIRQTRTSVWRYRMGGIDRQTIRIAVHPTTKRSTTRENSTPNRLKRVLNPLIQTIAGLDQMDEEDFTRRREAAKKKRKPDDLPSASWRLGGFAFHSEFLDGKN